MRRPTSLPQQISPPLNTRFLERDFRGCEAILLLQLALKKGVFDIIGESALTSRELAAALGGDPKKTAVFLDTLAALAYLVKRGDSYRLSPAARLYLHRGSEYSICDLLQTRFSRLQQLQQAGRRLLQAADNKEEREQDAAEAAHFTRIMAQSAVSSGSIRAVVGQIARDPAFKGARRMLDLGCSHGLYTAALCLLNGDLQAVLFDRPEVLPLTRQNLERYRFGGRVEYRSGNFNIDLPGEGYDLVFASNVFYRSPKFVTPVLQKIWQSLKPGGLLYLQHRYLDENRTSPAAAALYYCTRALRMPDFYVATLPEAVAGLRHAGFTVTCIRRSCVTGSTLVCAHS